MNDHRFWDDVRRMRDRNPFLRNVTYGAAMMNGPTPTTRAIETEQGERASFSHDPAQGCWVWRVDVHGLEGHGTALTREDAVAIIHSTLASFRRYRKKLEADAA